VCAGQARHDNGLLDTQSRDGPSYHQLLDLFGAVQDVVDVIWTCLLMAGVAVYAAELGKR
jgi:hypothetical protein